jgi:hypothetical protein
MSCDETPDYHIEQFWLYFKKSMINFYNDPAHKIITRDIDKWSAVLNNLQKNQHYNQIERQIRDYMICYGVDVIRRGNGYHIGLLGTNIKRWDKLSNDYKLSDEKCENIHCQEKCVYFDISRKLFQCCLEICIALNKDGIIFNDFLQDVELVIIQRNIQPLLEMATTIKKLCIYDILIKNVKWLLIYELKNKYGNDLFNNICVNTMRGKTIAKLIW